MGGQKGPISGPKTLLREFRAVLIGDREIAQAA